MHVVYLAMVSVNMAVMQAPTLATDTSAPVVLMGHTESVCGLAWADDSKKLATASDDRSIRVWDLTTGQPATSFFGIARKGYGGPVVAFTANLQLVAINYWGDISIRNLDDDQVLTKVDPILDRKQKSAFRPDVYAMAFSPDGKRLATAGSVAAVGGRHGLPGGIVIVWDTQSGNSIYVSDKLSTSASSVTWSMDGKRLVAGTSGAGGELQEAGEVWVWDTESWKPQNAFPVKPKTKYGEWASAADVAISSDGKLVAASVTAGSRGAPAGMIIESTGTSVRIWDLENGEDRQLVTGLKATVERVVFSPDGRRLATAGSDKVVRLWNAKTGMELAALKSPKQLTLVAFSPDGLLLATGSQDGSVRIWPLQAFE